MAAALGILLFALTPMSHAQTVSVSCSVSGRGSYPIFYKDDVVTCYVQGPASSAVYLSGYQGGYQGDTDSNGNFTSSAITMSQAGGPNTWTWSVGGTNAPQMTYWVVLDTPSLCQVGWTTQSAQEMASTDKFRDMMYDNTDSSPAAVSLDITASGGSGLAQQCSDIYTYSVYNYQYQPFLEAYIGGTRSFYVYDRGAWGWTCSPSGAYPRPTCYVYQVYPTWDVMYITATVWDYINQTFAGSTGPPVNLWVVGENQEW
ncbi:MAG TPA: hypothetical protein VLH09_01075 [Bryobacteraceae bacterium]|nr:hypothetical protein [Bryobacteraceae bacterium]